MEQTARDVPRKLLLGICLQGPDPSCLRQAANLWAADKPASLTSRADALLEGGPRPVET